MGTGLLLARYHGLRRGVGEVGEAEACTRGESCVRGIGISQYISRVSYRFVRRYSTAPDRAVINDHKQRAACYNLVKEKTPSFSTATPCATNCCTATLVWNRVIGPEPGRHLSRIQYVQPDISRRIPLKNHRRSAS